MKSQRSRPTRAAAAADSDSDSGDDRRVVKSPLHKQTEALQVRAFGSSLGLRRHQTASGPLLVLAWE